MPVLKNKFFLPVCLAGVMAGYVAAEWIMPRYFSPIEQQQIITNKTKLSTAQDILFALNNQSALQFGYYRQTKSGNYLASQHAQSNKNWDKASDYMSRVLERDKDNLDLKQHAMVLAMASGQIDRAITLAKDVMSETDDNLLAILFTSLDGFINEDYLKAIEVLDKTDTSSAAAFIVPVLKMWADTATGVFDTKNLDRNPFYAYHAMLAANYLNRGYEATEFALKAYDTEEIDLRDQEKIADLFAKAGETEKALSIYENIVEKGFTSNELAKKIKIIKAEDPIETALNIKKIKNPKEGAAIVFLDMAEILLREYSDDSATIFARMALALDPSLENGWMIIGNIFTRYEQYEQAIDQFEKIKESSKIHSAAQRQIADLYSEMNQSDKAIEILKSLYQGNDDIEAQIQIGDIHRYNEDFSAAVKAYNKVINEWDNVPEEYWHVLYARGMAHERLKNYKKSEQDLLAALKFRPNHPYLLNYLGYSWADQGIKLEKSLDMITRAALAQPEDGYIADSLGWVHYKMHDFEAAIPHLERAVELLPYDATINDHLGDAYWRVGRKNEARFQWSRAANYSDTSEDKLKTNIEEKLVSGLPDFTKEELNRLTEAREKESSSKK